MHQTKFTAIYMAALIWTIGFIMTISPLLAGAGAQETMPSPKAFPLPDAARGPEIPAGQGFLVEEIRDGLYWITEGVYTAMFLVWEKGVIAVDAPPTLGAVYLTAINDVSDRPVTHLIYSHSHADHIGAAWRFVEAYPDVEIIAHADTATQLERAGDPNRPLPKTTFEDKFNLKKGDQRLELEFRGVNHEPGNIYIYAPRQRVLMLVDVIFPGWVPFKNFALAEDIPGFIAAHDEVLNFDFAEFIGGHLNRPGSREDVKVQREYVHQVQTNAGKALANVDFGDVAAQVGAENPWLLFDTYLDAVARMCADLTEPAWLDRLGAADVFTFDHCWVMAESLRID